MFLDFNGNFGPPNGPTVGWLNNLPQDTTRGVGGKNLRALVANDPALTFFLKKVHPTFIHQMPNLPKVISTTFKLRLIQFKQFIVI